MPLRLVNWYAAVLPSLARDFYQKMSLVPTKVQAWNTIDPSDKELEKNIAECMGRYNEYN